jgi:hypothetical protein
LQLTPYSLPSYIACSPHHPLLYNPSISLPFYYFNTLPLPSSTPSSCKVAKVFTPSLPLASQLSAHIVSKRSMRTIRRVIFSECIQLSQNVM